MAGLQGIEMPKDDVTKPHQVTEEEKTNPQGFFPKLVDDDSNLFEPVKKEDAPLVEEKQDVWDGVKKQATEFVNYIKNQLPWNIVEGEDAEEVKRQLEGLLRGRMGELVSNEVSNLTDGLIWGEDNLDDVQKLKVEGNSDTKNYQLMKVAGQEFDESLIPNEIWWERVNQEFEHLTPIETKTKDGQVKEMAVLWKMAAKNARNFFKEERRQGFGSSGKEGMRAGIYYEQTVIPDGFLVDEHGKKIAPMEVKSYTNQEWKNYLEALKNNFPSDGTLRVQVGELNLGFEPEAELRFMDLLNGIDLDVPVEGDGRLVVLRVAKDIDQGVMSEIAKLIEEKYRDKAGNKIKLLVQKLPSTTNEMDSMAKRLLTWRLESFGEIEEKTNSEVVRAAEIIVGGKYVDGLGLVRDNKLERIRGTLTNGVVAVELQEALKKVIEEKDLSDRDKERLKAFRNFLKVEIQNVWELGKDDARRQGELIEPEIKWLKRVIASLNRNNDLLAIEKKNGPSLGLLGLIDGFELPEMQDEEVKPEENKVEAPEVVEESVELSEQEKIKRIVDALTALENKDIAEVDRLLKPILGRTT